MNRLFTQTGSFMLALSIVLAPVTGAQAKKPGVLANAPLFLSNSVKPNIFFLIDDSGSMNWEKLYTNRAITVDDPSDEDEGGVGYLDPTPSEEAEWREFCAAYNAMAYNPDITYLPWAGKDDDGDSFADVPVNAAPFDPYDHRSDTLNLERNACPEGSMKYEYSGWCWTNSVGFFYVKWNDDNGNGVYDSQECVPPRSQIPTDGGDYFPNNVPTDGKGQLILVKNMSTAEKQNYANWFSYYRKREYVMKRAVSVLVDEGTARMGLGTLHDNNRVGTAIADMENAGAKEDLLDNICRIRSSGDTPLRQRLEDAGQYYDQRDPSWWHYPLGLNDADPYLSAADGGSCQQNFTVLMTDGFWNGSPQYTSYPGFENNEDGDSDSDYDGGSYADDHDLTLADVAMYYYENDLHPGLSNDVPTSDTLDDRNPAQHMVTYTVGFGVNGTLSDNPPNRTDAFNWPEPESDEQTTIDDLRHAAWNGRGQFLSASNPEQLINGLKDALSSISSRVGSAASVAFNSGSLSTDTQIYVALFNSDKWSGEIQAYSLDPNTGAIGSSVWNAATLLDNRNLSTSSRTILTYDGTMASPCSGPI